MIVAIKQFPYFCSLILNLLMKNFYKKIGSLLLLLCAGQLLMAQQLSYKALSQELQSLQKQLVPDNREAILEIEIKDSLQPKVVVSGKTDLPDAKNQIIRFLKDKNVSFIDSVRLLPDSSLGDKIWALATLSVSNLRAKPEDASELVSQATMGTPMKILEYNNKWYRVQTPDHYIGWMDAAGLQQFTGKEMEEWKNSNRYLFNRISGLLLDAPNKKSGVISDLVLDDMFEVEATVKGFLKIRIADGRTGYVRKSDCISFNQWINQEPDAQSVLSVAKQMIGFPYLWGGTSSKGVDCSGLVKQAYFTQGVILSRDASQQGWYGESIDFKNRDNLQPGDLIFFGRSAERITHVGIYLGKGDFIHSSGKVHISSIDPGDPKYVPERNIVAARRILNSLNSEGIEQAKEHSWYISLP
jgi:gamma-D-glutamyl-L-lysine dipeptidyl-peptidase